MLTVVRIVLYISPPFAVRSKSASRNVLTSSLLGVLPLIIILIATIKLFVIDKLALVLAGSMILRMVLVAIVIAVLILTTSLFNIPRHVL